MTIYLRNILPFTLFKQMLDEGFIRSQVHPLHPELMIFNYTEKAQFDRVWNAATNVCRGLIVVVGPNGLDEDAVVLARPFNKFHNLNTAGVPETLEANLPNEAPLVTAKLDGSMGVLYQYKGEWGIATRGSFDSDQARWATKWYRESPFKPDWNEAYTPVFEIIYAENRIVVDYDFEGMFLLSMVEVATGHEVTREMMEEYAHKNMIPAVPKFAKTLAQCAAEDNPNEEGYVLTYSNNVKVKVKFAEYVRLHRVITGWNPKTVWEMLATGSNVAIDTLLNDPKMPEAFVAWLRLVATELMTQYTQLERAAQEVFRNTPHYGESIGGMTKEERAQARKVNAMYYKQTPHLSSVLFAMLDSKNYAEIIWDRVKPKATDTFKKDGE